MLPQKSRVTTDSAIPGRMESFGQEHRLTAVDQFGVWLSGRQLRRHAHFAGKRVADFGCGFHASFARTVFDEAAHVCLLDVSLAADLKGHPKVSAIEGRLPESLFNIPSASMDVILSVSVLEHLWEPVRALFEFRRILAPGGVCLLNVPSWRGKLFLEFSAFRLGLSPSAEMDDHKMYYDTRDLWPLLVQSGFRPRDIRCFAHKFGLNTFAICKTES
jgi:SAM-dependent methyltransferase